MRLLLVHALSDQCSVSNDSYGPSILDCGIESGKQQAALTLVQLAMFNATKTDAKQAKHSSATTWHSKEREPPLPVYIGLTVHSHTRKEELGDTLYVIGIGISYKRVLEISSELAYKAWQQFEVGSVVCPMMLRSGLYTTAAVDNTDHNPS